MAKIYLSSTYSDLVGEREVVYDTLRKLRHDVVSMEDYGATDERPLEKCLADVAASDLYVGIFAWRYGYVPPEQKGDAKQSITELEYREAVDLGKPCLIFLLADDAPWPRNRMDPDPAPIEALREELQRNHVVAFFKTADELAADVGVAVANAWKEPATPDVHDDPSRLGFYRDTLSRMTSEMGKQIRLCVVSSGALIALGTGILVTGTLVSGNQVLGLGGTLLGATAVFPMAAMFTTRRKKAVLDGYHAALGQSHPAREVVVTVKRFLDVQLGLREAR